MNNPYRDIEALDDLIRTELENGGHEVWLSQALADLLSTEDAVDFVRTFRRHLDHVLLPQPGAEDES